jgi:starch-binding outer membrane protein, SusD/RagB family
MNKFSSRLLVVVPVGAMLCFAIAACSKSFLKQDTIGLLTETELKSSKGATQQLIAAYAAIKGNGWESGGSNWVYGSIIGGEANKGSDAGDQADINPIVQYSALPTNAYFNLKWTAVYNGVARANSTIRTATALTDADIEPALKAQIIAEARFLRGYYHLEAKKMWNNIPFVDETINYTDGNYRVSNTEDAWPKIMEDLDFARNNLDVSKTEIGRVNKWAAEAFYAKALMFQGKYAEAIPVFNEVITNGVNPKGVKYQLAAKYHDLFDASTENNDDVRGECILAYEASINDGSTGANANFEQVLNFPYADKDVPGTCCGFFQPTIEFVNSFRTDATGLPLLDGSYNDDANAVKNDMGLLSTDAFTPDAGNLDPRLDWTVGRRGLPYLDWGNHPGRAWLRDQSNGGPYAPKKLVYPKSQAGTFTDGTSWTSGLTAINYKLMRFADVLLMAAEAEIEAGSLETARGYINQVRQRAANTSGFVRVDPADTTSAPAANYVISLYTNPFASQDDARAAVRMERKLELGEEGHRFFDLVRWGIAQETINTFISVEKKALPSTFGNATFTAPKNNYFPIPQGQIDLHNENGASTLTQNEGY